MPSLLYLFFFFSSRRRHTRCSRDWSSDVCSSDLDGGQMTIYDASLKYAAEGTPLIVLAGKEYGAGSSRDWAAKGPRLLGVRAVIAESFERIHRSNLVGMGILPLQFAAGQNPATLGLTGKERYDILGLAETPKELTASATASGRSSRIGLPQFPHLGCCSRRVRSTRFSVWQNGQATVALRVSMR